MVGQANGHFALARYLADGSIDTSFGNNGRVTTPIGGSSEARSVAINQSGSIYVAGVTSHPLAVVAKYDSNGALDLSWGDSGVSKPHIPEIGSHETSQANAIAVHMSRVFIAGSYRETFYSEDLSHLSKRSMFYAELTSNGSVSWGLNKIDVFPNLDDGAYQEEIANDLVVDPTNNHLYVVGQATRSTTAPVSNKPVTLFSQAVVARFHLFVEHNYPALSIDKSYGKEVIFNPDNNELPEGDGQVVGDFLLVGAIV